METEDGFILVFQVHIHKSSNTLYCQMNFSREAGDAHDCEGVFLGLDNWKFYLLYL